MIATNSHQKLHTQRIVVAHVEDRPGVLARVASLFRRRGFNIESLTVGHSDEPGVSRMTIVVDGQSTQVQQVERQLFKLVDVVSAINISDRPMVARELALIKVSCTPQGRRDIIDLAGAFRADVVDVGDTSVIVQVLGDEDKVDALANLLRPYGVLELVRTGRVAMVRGSGTSKPEPVSAVEQLAEEQRAQFGRRPAGALPFASD
jgi:acetolactate synthase-1/3 small subunit